MENAQSDQCEDGLLMAEIYHFVAYVNNKFLADKLKNASLYLQNLQPGSAVKVQGF